MTIRESVTAGALALLALAVCVGMSWGGYLLYLRFVEGPAITQHGQNIRHSINFIQAANMRAEGLMPDYTTAVEQHDDTRTKALRLEICSAANSINASEQADDVRSFAVDNCGGH